MTTPTLPRHASGYVHLYAVHGIDAAGTTVCGASLAYGDDPGTCDCATCAAAYEGRTVTCPHCLAVKAERAAAADAAIALHYAERSIAEQGDPWAIAQGVPVGRGAAPLSGPCCVEEPAQ